MRIDALTVALRPRTSWEAMELGSALVRANARAVWAPWLLLTAPLYALALLAGWVLMDSATWGMLLFWWLLPVFDRVPLYVLSRAVFGAAPTPRQTLRAQLHWGLRHLPGLLLWRRLTPRRPVAMSIDLLEGVRGPQRAARMRLVAGGTWAPALALTAMCALFVLVLHAGVVSLVIAFDPTFLGADAFTTLERVSAYMRALTDPTADPNHAVRVAWHVGYYVALTVVQPFFVGGGFGLYLNRRTELEAWDLEIAFRRLRRRLEGVLAAVLAVGLALVALAPVDARASGPTEPARAVVAPGTAPNAQKTRASRLPPVTPIERIFPEPAPADALRDGLARAAKHPDLRPTKRETRLERRPTLPPEAPDAKKLNERTWLESVMEVFTFFGKHGLVILLVAAVILLTLRWRRWWPWLSGLLRDPEAAPAVVATAVQEQGPLPDDIVAAARARWRAADPRGALALLYRASADAVAERAGVVMVPGATEAEYLRVARRLGDVAARSGFQRVVRAWQYAAYAHRMPGDDEFEGLVGELAPAFGWRA